LVNRAVKGEVRVVEMLLEILKTTPQTASSEQNGSAPNAKETEIRVTFVKPSHCGETPEERQDRLNWEKARRS
jgi:hypothetical protein